MLVDAPVVLMVAVMMVAVAMPRDAAGLGDVMSAAVVARVARPMLAVTVRGVAAGVLAAALERDAEGLSGADRDQALREEQGPGHEVEERRRHRGRFVGAGRGDVGGKRASESVPSQPRIGLRHVARACAVSFDPVRS